MNTKIDNIDDYIAEFSESTQVILNKVRKVIREVAPDATEAISYGMPTFKLNGNLVHFAAFKNHIGIYPTPSGIDAFNDEVSQYRTGKGTIQFPLDKPIPYDLIERITKYRVQANLSKK